MYNSIESSISDQIMEVSAEIFDLIELVDWAVKASPSFKNVDCWEIYVLIVRLSSGVG
jgi:hypothetical protein